ncbi:hypothetical protein L198_06910 [Cryptococcus wingfieldii CBS 7118]|uniref:Cytochrome P450 n=1 Tax=Cryptococcus wingfieldii CBS 7118 TaxID=1295528 RepID=A0A1E3IID3_9TREE|nr:hypothetical protein L198_06910 [Cryptococcus wingfieldii CBS 7118]ODN87686.1 hypothetical protein L198_06910 [Cryptococcus wingfieldii CBS 7118]
MGALDVLPAHLPTVLRDSPPLYKASATLIVFVLATYLWLFPIANARIPFRNLPDPGPGHWLLGHVMNVFLAPTPNATNITFHKAHGPTIKYRTQLGRFEVSTIDPTAIAYILNHPDIFVKPPALRDWLYLRIGNGLVTAEGEHHKKQRKAMIPSFSPAAIRELAPVMLDVANELKDKLDGLIAHKDEYTLSPSPAKPIDAVPGGAKVNILRYINMSTFDVIGLTGFGHSFGSLSDRKNDLTASMQRFLQNMFVARLVDYLFGQYQFQLPTEKNRVVNKEKQEILEFARRIAAERKKEILEQSYGEGINKKQDIGKDLLSLLSESFGRLLCILNELTGWTVKANMASDMKPNERLTDEDVADQILTFLVAGSETTATSLALYLDIISQHIDVQDRLRKELLSVNEERPPFETLDNLPYLEAVIRECLRFFPAASFIYRHATEEATVPLGTPVIGKNGKLMTEFKMDTVNLLFIPVRAVNTSPTLWGPDAESFNPCRFLDDDRTPGTCKSSTKVPGVYGNLMTFIGGPRNCIGYKFALQQMKILLFVLLRNFEFRPLKSGPEMVYKPSAVVQAFVKGEEHLGVQIPLMVIPLAGAGHDKDE